MSEPRSSKNFSRRSIFRALVGIVAGVIVGCFFRSFGALLKPLGDEFLKLIRMLVAPAVFFTVVTGIAEFGDLRQLGRVGLKSLLYFESVTTFALVIGLVAATLTQPDSFLSAFTRGEMPQVLLLAVFYGIALATLRGEKKLLGLADSLSQFFFKMIALVMGAAPLGAFGAMVFTIGRYGVSSLLSLGGCSFAVTPPALPLRRRRSRRQRRLLGLQQQDHVSGRPLPGTQLLPDKGAILCALHQRAGETLVLNGAEDNLVAAPHHGESFFADLKTRVQALAGTGVPTIEYRFYPGVGHRPSWVNLDAATWLNARLHFPRWQNISLNSLGETHIAEWAAATGAHINHGYESEKTEGGIHALGQGFPTPTRAELQAVPEADSGPCTRGPRDTPLPARSAEACPCN